MPTNKELENQVQQLEARVSRVQTSNSQLRDELADIKRHYSKLVEGLNLRFEDMQENFLSRQ